MTSIRPCWPLAVLALGSCLLWTSACGRQAASTAAPPAVAEPALPPLQLQPFLPVLQELAAADLPPAPPVQRELEELADVALQRVAADARTTAMAERSLLSHEAAWFVLAPALQDDNTAVRRRAAWLAGRSGLLRMVPPLLLRLKYELDPDAILWVADALQQLGNDAGLAWLDAAMGHAATAERAGAMALAICQERSIELPDPATYAALQQAMQQLGSEWRRAGRGGRPNLPELELAVLEPLYAAGLALTEGTLLRPVDDAKFILSRSGVAPVQLLQRTLAASEPYLRTVALEMLGALGAAASAAAPAVLPLLGDPLTEAYAVRTLGEIGGSVALPHLRRRLRDGDTELRTQAAYALGLLRDRDSETDLRTALASAAEALDVRVAAAFALLRLGEDQAAAEFLDARQTAGDFHPSKLRHLRERLSW